MPTLISELTPLQSMWLYEHQLTRGDSYEEKWHRFAGPPPGYGDPDPDRRVSSAAPSAAAPITTGGIFRSRPSKRRLPFEEDEEDRGRGRPDAEYSSRRAPSPPSHSGGGGGTGRSAHGPRFPHTGEKLTWAQSRENLKVYYDHYGVSGPRRRVSPCRRRDMTGRGTPYEVLPHRLPHFSLPFPYTVQNCNVPQKYRDNRKLGRWVNKQRKKKKNPAKYGALTAEQVADLDSLGFAWNP